MIAMLGSIGLPGTSGFVGEFLSILGIYQTNVVMAFLTATGVILGAIYMLKLYKEVMLGAVTNKEVATFKDLHLYEIAAIAPLCVLIIYLGIMPNSILNMLNSSVSKVLLLR